MKQIFTLLFLALAMTSFAQADVSVADMQSKLVESFGKVTIGNEKYAVKQSSLDAKTKENALPYIQKQIDLCCKSGGGTVTVEPGEYLLCGPLYMRTGVELHLHEGAVLKFSGKASDFLPVVKTRWEGTELMGRQAMVNADGAENFAITGKGTIDAQAGVEMARWGMAVDVADFEENAHGTHGETMEMNDVNRLRQMGDDNTPIEKRIFGEGTYLRPCAMEFRNCNNFLIEGITLKNSPFWCIHPLYCDNVTVRGVTIESNYPNNDGCDPESSRNVLIEDCLFRTGDDAIAIKAGRDADGRRVGKPCENIVIRNCKFYSKCNGLCIGSEMSGGVDNIIVHNVEIGDVKNALLFKSNLDRGGYIRNVWVDNITIRSAIGAVLRFETNYFGYRGGNFPSAYSNFNISNVVAEKAEGYAIYYDGNEQKPITDVTVSNFTVKQAARPYYLFHTKNCTFHDSQVNGNAIPLHPEESKERQSCDVW